MPPRSSNPDAKLVRDLVAWFDANKRDLPWRPPHSAPGPEGGTRHAWHALMAEAMLQQTQVSRVLEKFPLFADRFPTPASMAKAQLDEVLAMWSGLGYYRRARSLHAAAVAIVERFDGRVPSQVSDLLTLPGVGRYTAGAIASIVFEQAEPIVDGNVTRVLMRHAGDTANPTDKDTIKRIWARAESLAAEAARTGVVDRFNEGLMELGALVCTPSAPACAHCPLSSSCKASKRNLQCQIPRPKAKKEKETRYIGAVFLDASPNGARTHVVMEQRPQEGLWGGLWQLPCVERTDRLPTKDELESALGIAGLTKQKNSTLTRQLTHRTVIFERWDGPRGFEAAADLMQPGWKTVAIDELDAIGVNNAQRLLILGR